MSQKLISSGAEANLFLVAKKESSTVRNLGVLCIKDRVAKKYRLKQIDDKIRKLRTKQETKLLEKAGKIINVPKIIQTNSKENNQFKIYMNYVRGKKLSENLEKLSKNQAEKVCNQIGESIAKLHDNEIIHGDLTTSNLILDKDNKVWFIDFGLGFISLKLEDKAVDLHVLKQAVEARHYQHHEIFWKSILKGYKKSKNNLGVIERLRIVESRGRYKDKY
jgi:Kae1-associated kinase Bud32